MKKFHLNLLILSALFCILFSLTSCGAKSVTWNGDTEYYAHVNMVVDETNLYEYVGAVDYVFVGTVEKIVKNVIPDEPNSSDADLSVYKIRVDENLKGELTENIEGSKHGGFKKDGTMMLMFSDRSKDTGLPESGNQYIFLAYAQPDGSLTLSEFFDNRQYNDDLLQEYLDYCSNEVLFDRTRFVSSYDKSRASS